MERGRSGRAASTKRPRWLKRARCPVLQMLSASFESRSSSLKITGARATVVRTTRKSTERPAIAARSAHDVPLRRSCRQPRDEPFSAGLASRPVAGSCYGHRSIFISTTPHPSGSAARDGTFPKASAAGR